MQTTIEHVVREQQRLMKASQHPRVVEYEAEIRLGVRADASGKRIRNPIEASRWYSANIGQTHFFGVFAALVATANEITSKNKSIHNRFARDAIDKAIRCECQHDTERWTHKTVVSQTDLSYQAWFDVRIALAKEARIDPPAAILEARCIGARLRRAWEHPRARLAIPVHTRVRHRRSLRYRDAKAWRIDFTTVETSHLIKSNHNSSESMEHTYVHDADTHEIELEYVGGLSCTAERAAEQAIVLLQRLSVALGRNASEVRKKLEGDGRDAEIAVMTREMTARI